MKRFFLSFSVLLFFASCITDKLATDTDVSPEVVAVSTDPLSVPLDKALEEMYSTMDILYGPATRSSRPAIASIETLKGEHLGNKTRSGDPLPENLLYLVNFGEQDGFAILGATTYLPPVLGIAEKGTITIAEIVGDSPSTRATESPEPTLEDLWVEEDGDYLIGSSGRLGPFIRKAASKDPADRRMEEWGPSTYQVYSEWTPKKKVGPLLSTKWHQYSPFNLLCFRRNDIQVAGCVTIAAAQIIAYNQKPDNSYYELESTWPQLISYDYDDLSITEDRGQRHKDVSIFVRKVAEGCKVKFDFFWTGNSFGTPEKVKKYFKTIGYDDAAKLKDIREDKVLEMLDNDCPVFVGAMGKVEDAHAWVIDGYMQQERTVQEMNSLHKVIRESTETRTFVHCNYGWYNGDCNGYYVCKIFDTRNGPIETEPDEDSTSMFNWSVNTHYRMITYSK